MVQGEVRTSWVSCGNQLEPLTALSHVCMYVCLFFSSEVFAPWAVLAGLLGQVPHVKCCHCSEVVDIERLVILFLFIVFTWLTGSLNHSGGCPM